MAPGVAKQLMANLGPKDVVPSNDLWYRSVHGIIQWMEHGDNDAIRLILAELANVPGAKFITFDFVRAYLQAKLPKDYKPIYMRVMRGFEDDFPDKNTVFLLGVNMYGLVTVAYYWWLELCRGMERRVGKGATRKVVFGGKTHRAAPFTLQCTLTMP